MIFDRQYFMRTVAGDYDSLKSTAMLGPTASLKDGPQDVRLYIESHAGQDIVVAANTSVSISLPEDYTNADQLFVLALVEGTLRFVVTSPLHAASTALVKGTAATPGSYSITGRVTALTISNPSLTDNARLKYMLVPLPDLNLASSYFGGNLITGTNSEPA